MTGSHVQEAPDRSYTLWPLPPERHGRLVLNDETRAAIRSVMPTTTAISESLCSYVIN